MLIFNKNKYVCHSLISTSLSCSLYTLFVFSQSVSLGPVETVASVITHLVGKYHLINGNKTTATHILGTILCIDLIFELFLQKYPLDF